MNTIQRNIIEFLNDYRRIIKNQAKDFEEHGLETNSWRLKNKLSEIESTLQVFTHTCEHEEAKNMELRLSQQVDRRKH